MLTFVVVPLFIGA